MTHFASNAGSIYALGVSVINPRPTRHDVRNGVDMDVSISMRVDFQGEHMYDCILSGEVTFAPAEYDGELAPYGRQIDHWISNGLVKQLHDMPEGVREAIIDLLKRGEGEREGEYEIECGVEGE